MISHDDVEELKAIVLSKQMKKKDLEECISKAFTQKPSNVWPFPSNENRLKDALSATCVWIYFIIRIILHVIKISCVTFLLLLVLYLLASTNNVTQKFIMRNSQNYIYPIMRTVRLWSLPILMRYHGLTDWHEEDCLVKNPFYQEPLLECWPCEDVRTMVDLTSLKNYSKAYVYNEKPFIVRDAMDKKFTIDDLAKVYRDNRIKLDRGTARFSSTHIDVHTLSDLVQRKEYLKTMKEFQVQWKINRVAAARVLRKTFKRPYFVPNNSEVALQRFLSISGSEAPQHFLPTTDFANVWIAQGQGYRLLVLDPTEPCQKNCSTVSILLRPQDVLYYNWQFWKPRSLPARLSEDLSITYMGSFY